MRIFEKPNTSGDWKCPICGTAEEKPITLIGIEGTEDGMNQKAEQMHVDCLNLQVTGVSDREDETTFAIFMYYMKKE